MIPVSPHGEFTPIEFAPTIKFLFRVCSKILSSYLRSCHRVIKRFRRTISDYVCLISLDDDCSLVAAGARVVTKSNGYRSSRHHQGVSPLTNSPPSEVSSPRQWIKKKRNNLYMRLDLVGGELDQFESMWGRTRWGANSLWGETGSYLDD